MVVPTTLSGAEELLATGGGLVARGRGTKRKSKATVKESTTSLDVKEIDVSYPSITSSSEVSFPSITDVACILDASDRTTPGLIFCSIDALRYCCFNYFLAILTLSCSRIFF
jgi:hypothetical protein